jgi:hypothetical protein
MMAIGPVRPVKDQIDPQFRIATAESDDYLPSLLSKWLVLPVRR